MPLAKGCTLTAEEEWERRNPVRNHLCIKQQPRWKDQEEDEKEKPGRKKATELRIRDLEREKVGLKLNIQKTVIMASDPITSWQIEGHSKILVLSSNTIY